MVSFVHSHMYYCSRRRTSAAATISAGALHYYVPMELEERQLGVIISSQ